MKFFKKKPKPDVMGFICCETSLNRAHYMAEHFHDDKLYYPSYLFSTAIIFYNLEKKYSEELIDKIENHCDRFFIKKNKTYSQDQILSDRSMVKRSLMKQSQIADFLEMSRFVDETGEIADILDDWMAADLLLNEDIKSM